MVAKNLHEAILKARIRDHIRWALYVGPMEKVNERIDAATEKMTQQLLGELRDYFGHKAMELDWSRSEETHRAIIKFFNECFVGVNINGGKE